MHPRYCAVGSGIAAQRSSETGVVDVAVIVVTRLRSKDHSCLDDLFTAAVAFLGQAQGLPGILGADEARSSPSPVEEC